MFPNLHEAYLDSAFPWAFLPLVLGPRLVRAHFDSLAPEFGHAIVFLARKCPSVKYVSLLMGKDHPPDSMFATMLADAVSLGLQNVERLHLGTPDVVYKPSAILSTLSRMKSLDALILDLESPSTSRLPSIPSRTSLPSLTQLTLESGGPKEVMRIMSCIRDLSNLATFHATLKYGPEDKEADISDMIASLVQTLPETMLSIHLSNVDPTIFAPSPAVFRPLFRFNQLFDLTVNFVFDPPLNDDDMEALSLALPRLKSLSLPLLTGSHAITRTTLQGLATLLRNCRHLSELSLALDLTTATNAAYDALPPWVRNTQITSLSLGNSPMDDPAFAARHLLRLIPRLSSLPEYNGSDPNAGVWEEVERLVKQHASRVPTQTLLV
ncbi:hypothetical protein CONPUDRAFT_154913 [Coniophora puteana RWD-64-598 SS2]|uniref:F-box domain-containing protein n=1 Tax=Coniophora puteana (strain RWD-64-598) TaxID=741705 RepID=A0A5M3ML20_CONPW|nr:uncharacterized protein CONPUDRAFT_154913 [Coniophora puteana RWD-64-598 SS2]EIW79514.1 hypothetical protein CONPUDRAFT_154913 [Coniophora puteana RWD-64-598 SS2]